MFLISLIPPRLSLSGSKAPGADLRHLAPAVVREPPCALHENFVKILCVFFSNFDHAYETRAPK
jgi:hypothetical protein